MEEKETELQEPSQELLYSKKDFENYKAKLEEEFLEKENQIKTECEQEVKKSSMTELELVQAELKEVKEKYQKVQEECLIATQKEETASLLKDANLYPDALEIVYVPLDMEKTKEKIELLKTFVETVKKEINQDFMGTTVPLASKETSYDAFIEGFDSNEL